MSLGTIALLLLVAVNAIGWWGAMRLIDVQRDAIDALTDQNRRLRAGNIELHRIATEATQANSGMYRTAALTRHAQTYVVYYPHWEN